MSDILTTKEAADFLKISVRKLRNMAKETNPPPKHMVGKQPRYIREELVEWLRNPN